MKKTKDWLNPNIFTPTSNASMQILQDDTTTELTVEGPTRTGKTLVCLLKLFYLHMHIKGLRTAIVRAHNVDLDATIRHDIRNTLLKYDLNDPRSPVQPEGGTKKFHTLYINGGECRIGGLYRPQHILGTEYDLIFISQLEQLTEEQFQILRTRCTGSAGNWRTAQNTPISQILSDCNPDTPHHWMYTREKNGQMKFVKFDFHDNPKFFRQNRWSPDGYKVVTDLNQSLTGIYHDRYFKGYRVAAEGSVFHIQDCHILDELPNLDNYQLYNAMDFGMKTPSTCLWIAWNRAENDVIVFREWRKTMTNILEMGHEINYINAQNAENISNTIIERDLNHYQLLSRECNIYCTLARKGPGSIMDGIHLIQNALTQTTLQKPGGLRIYRHLRCNTDPNPNARTGPQNLIQELQNLRYDPEKNDAILDEDDHAIDPLRYFYLWKQGPNQPLQHASDAHTAISIAALNNIS